MDAAQAMGSPTSNTSFQKLLYLPFPISRKSVLKGPTKSKLSDNPRLSFERAAVRVRGDSYLSGVGVIFYGVER